MTISEAFDEWQEVVNADPALVDLARARRKSFEAALSGELDIAKCLPSGSIARGSQIEPINDVDLVVIYKRDLFPNWGDDGTSASEALEDLADKVRSLLGGSGEKEEQLVRLVKPGNHAVQCWIDDPDEEDAFTVDVVPALQEGDHLIIPESDNRTWIHTHPAFLVDAVLKRHHEWPTFVPLVRVLKRWNRDNDMSMLPLVVEVLALSHMPQDDRPKALASFFTGAAAQIDSPIQDPSGVGGTIQPDLNISKARRALEKAADKSWSAVQAAEEGDNSQAQCIWRDLFGADFPAPPEGCGKVKGGAGAAVGVSSIRRPVRDSAQG